MQIQRRLLVAFLLNLGFSVFEFFGGVFTGSVATAGAQIEIGGNDKYQDVCWDWWQ